MGFRRAVRRLTWPMVPFYAMAVRVKNAVYDLRLIEPRVLASPVVSVGNLSVGGTGKTPFVLLLAELLAARGWGVDVLSRGYGRSSRIVIKVHPGMEAAIAGDEPLLLARRGVPVFVGANRYAAGRLAEQAEGAVPRRVHLLDDGFQHRRLGRAVNIVLLDRVDLEDDMLPAGRLREPLCALERADICVLRAGDAGLRGRVMELMRQSDLERVWLIERSMILPAVELSPAVAFCGIANPQEFFAGLRQAGVRAAAELPFRDHRPYTANDLARLIAAARSTNARSFLTTEKDAVRMSDGQRLQLESVAPVATAELSLTLHEVGAALTLLEALLQQSAAGMR